MNIFVVLAAFVISATTRVQCAPVNGLEKSNDSPLCFMLMRRPHELVKIPCESHIDAIGQVYYFINGHRFQRHPEIGRRYLSNLAEFIYELKEVATHDQLENDAFELQKYNKGGGGLMEESEEVDYEDSEGDISIEEDGVSGRRFGVIIPMAQLAIKELGRGFGMDIPTNAEVQRARENQAHQQELLLFRLAQGRADEEAIDAKKQISELIFKAQQASIDREAEIATLKELVSLMKNNRGKEQIEKTYRELLLERDSKILEKEIDGLKRKMEIDDILTVKKLEEFKNKYEIEKTVEAGQDKIEFKKLKEKAKSSSTFRATPKCSICG